MKLIELLKGNLGLSEDLNSSTESISNEDFSYKNDYIIKKACKVYNNEICIQKNIAENSNMLIPGFTELTNELRKISPDTIISMRFIDSNNWAGRIFFDEEKKLIGLILGKKKNKNWVTPPNWDGSEEMLKKYNTENK
ncbi:hypothetical protein [Pseudomonas chlororaphis]|uniref:hypothetical protein n=1 Tax=Pseudomonas chlororaphis TaxID=587753 RepID=UPI002367E92C|nr:hypothetical protein [Pseudomonas chlororaphis]WDH35663.1 hypothetical protein PUP62_02225 [Pseudomonas chlororaphis]WDH41748.1 hypothetical protein PUP51_02225 [Pseudomonas chlororaphis]